MCQFSGMQTRVQRDSGFLPQGLHRECHAGARGGRRRPPARPASALSPRRRRGRVGVYRTGRIGHRLVALGARREPGGPHNTEIPTLEAPSSGAYHMRPFLDGVGVGPAASSRIIEARGKGRGALEPPRPCVGAPRHPRPLRRHPACRPRCAALPARRRPHARAFPRARCRKLLDPYPERGRPAGDRRDRVLQPGRRGRHHRALPDRRTLLDDRSRPGLVLLPGGRQRTCVGQEWPASFTTSM